MTKITQKPKYVGFGQSFSKNDKKFIRPKKVDKIIKFDNPIGIAHIEYTNEPPIFKHLQKYKEKIIKECLKKTFSQPHTNEQIELIKTIYSKIRDNINEVLFYG